MSNKFLTQYYENMLLSVKESTSHGRSIHAKAILLLAIIKNIEEHKIIANKIFYNNELRETYNFLFDQYIPEYPITSPVYPFYYLRNDGFMSLKFEEENIKLRKTPSTKYIQDNVQYASFDNALWDILQDEQSRDTLKHSIINYFFKSNE